MNRSVSETNHFKKLIEEKIAHHFLWKKIEKPEIDEDKLFILSQLTPQDSTLTDTQREVYIVTTMLVQIALDTHDLVVENRMDESNEEKLINQLHVLAGDYYSGLYYYLLSELNDISFIHKLASAIKAINEDKMKLYYKEYDSYQEYMELRLRIDSLLLETVAIYFNRQELVDLFKQWLFITYVDQEREEIIQDEIWLNNKMVSKPSSVFMSNEDKLTYLFHREWSVLLGLVNELPYGRTEVMAHFNRRKMDVLYLNTSNVEEG